MVRSAWRDRRGETAGREGNENAKKRERERDGLQTERRVADGERQMREEREKTN